MIATSRDSLRRYRLDSLIILSLAVATSILVYWQAQRISPEIYLWPAIDLLFDSDVPRVFGNMTERFGDHYRTNAHPLFSLITYPITRAFINLLGWSRYVATWLVIAGMAALWVCLLYLLLRLARCRPLDALLFSLLGLSTAAATYWLIVPETYVFGSASILVALIFVAMGQRRRLDERWGLLVSVLTLSFTTTNWIAGLLATFLHYPWKRALQININAFAIVVVLWGVQKAFFPSAEFFLTFANDSTFLLQEESGGPLAVTQSFLSHTIVMPAIRVAEHYYRPPGEWQMLLTQGMPPGSGSAWGLPAIVLWLALLAFGLKGLLEADPQRGFRLALLLLIASQFALHLVYGPETFLYALHFAPLFIMVAAFGTRTRFRPIVLGMALIFGVALTMNNQLQLNQTIAYLNHGPSGVATPAPPLESSQAVPPASLPAITNSGQAQVRQQRMERPDDPWPRSEGHVVLALPGSQESQKAYHEPGGSFSPAPGSFGLSLWVSGKNGDLIATGDTIPLAELQQRFIWSPGATLPAIRTESAYYDATWSVTPGGGSQLQVRARPDLNGTLALVVRGVGPAGGPVYSVRWEPPSLWINDQWRLTIDPAPATVHTGLEGVAGWIADSTAVHAARDDDGWAYARMDLAGATEWHITLSTMAETPDESSPVPAPQLSSTLNLDLPDPRFLDSLDAQLAHIMMGLVGDETRPGDPLVYPLAWQRDGAYIVVALARSGQLDLARRLSEHLAEHDFYGGFGSEADAPGLALWALEEVAARLDDPQYDLWLWPHTQRKAELIRQLRAATEPVHFPYAGPVVPALAQNPDTTLVADPGRDGLIIGRMDHHRPLLYVNAVSYRGLHDAAVLAERLGHTEQAAQWRQEANELQRSWIAAFESPEVENPRTHSSSLWPSRVAVPIADTQLRQIMEARWGAMRDEQGAFREPRLWTYFDIAEAHQWLHLGQLDRVWETLDWFWARQASPGLYTWWEGDTPNDAFRRWEAVRGWVDAPHVTPHYWTAAEMLLLQLDMLLSTDLSGTLVVGAGVPEAWLARPLHVGPIRTLHGQVEWQWDGQQVTVTRWGEPAPVRLGPAFPPATSLEVTTHPGE